MWSISLNDVSEATHIYTATATDSAGNASAASEPVTVIFDKTAPQTTTVTPSKAKVSRTASVTATFSWAMDSSTLDTTTVKLVKKGTTTPVAASVSYDAATKKVSLTPSKRLKSGETYEAMFAIGAKYAADNPLATAKVWSFTIKQ